MKDEVLGSRQQAVGSTRKRNPCRHPTERRNQTQIRCGRCGAFLRRLAAVACFFIFLSLNFFVVRPSEAALEHCLDAVCRVSHSNGDGTRSVGSGCAFEINANEVRILTNYHVAEGRDDLTVEFWRAGHQSVRFRGVTRWGSYDPRTHRDIAVVGVPLADFAGLPPAIVPLAAPEASPLPGDTVLSAGCELGRWPSAWRGHVVGQADAAAVRFQPISVEGRSGSALFNADGSAIVGLIAWHDGTHGLAMTAAEIHRAFRGENRESRIENRASNAPSSILDSRFSIPTQFPGPWRPSQCPPGRLCPAPRAAPPAAKPAGPYPTLPAAAPPIVPGPAAPSTPAPSCNCPPDPASQTDLAGLKSALEAEIHGQAAQSAQALSDHAQATDGKLAKQASANESKLQKLADGIKSAIEKAQTTPAGQAAEKVAGGAIDAAAGAGAAALLRQAITTGGLPAAAIAGIGLLIYRRLKPAAASSSTSTPETIAAAVAGAIASHTSAAAGGAAPSGTFHGRATPTSESDGPRAAQPARRSNAIASPLHSATTTTTDDTDTGAASALPGG